MKSRKLILKKPKRKGGSYEKNLNFKTYVPSKTGNYSKQELTPFTPPPVPKKADYYKKDGSIDFVKYLNNPRYSIKPEVPYSKKIIQPTKFDNFKSNISNKFNNLGSQFKTSVGNFSNSVKSGYNQLKTKFFGKGKCAGSKRLRKRRVH